MMRLAITFPLLCGLLLMLLWQIEASSSNTDISNDEGQKNTLLRILADYKEPPTSASHRYDIIFN